MIRTDTIRICSDLHRAAWQFGDSPAQAINQGFHKGGGFLNSIALMNFAI